MDLVKRMKATQRTQDKYQGRTFRYGTADCIQLVVQHAKHMGHPIKLPKYNDVKGAAATLRSLGFKNLSEALDHHFERIDPSRVLLGDLIEVPGENGFSSIMVAVGNGRTIGFHQDIPFADNLQPLMITGAWRIESRKSTSRKH